MAQTERLTGLLEGVLTEGASFRSSALGRQGDDEVGDLAHGVRRDRTEDQPGPAQGVLAEGAGLRAAASPAQTECQADGQPQGDGVVRPEDPT